MPPTSRRCARDGGAAGSCGRALQVGLAAVEDKALIVAWDRLHGMLSTLDSKTSVLLRFNAIVVAASMLR
jgi:hypothetical protein